MANLYPTISSIKGYGNKSSVSDFPDPFLVPSNHFMPQNLDTALDFSLLLYHKNARYRRTTIRTVSHFITDLDISTQRAKDGNAHRGDRDEKDEHYDFLINQLGLFESLLQMGQEWGCFSGDTPVQTEEGVFPIKDLEGQTVKVLGQGGQFREAEFKSFGIQELYELEFADGQKIRTTAEHKWLIKNCSGKETRVETKDLNLGHKVPRAAAAVRPEKNEDYYTGVRHGFIYGDGTEENAKKDCKTTTRAYFHGDKDKALMPFFEDHHNEIHERTDKDYECWLQSGHPGEWKSLPAMDASPSYWYGFICGFLAADGCVDSRDGCVVLCQAPQRKEVLEAISVQAPRVGMHVGHVLGEPIQREGRYIDSKWTGPSELYHLHLLKNFMQEEDFLIPEHRENFLKHYNPESKYGQWMGIKGIRKLDVWEEVYCCVEMETHTMSVGNGIVTGQCYGNSFWRMHYPFNRFLVDKRGGGFATYSVDMFQGHIKYHYKDLTYEIPDPTGSGPLHERARVRLPFIDRPDLSSVGLSRIRPVALDPKRIFILFSHMSRRHQYVYRFEDWFKKDIQEGEKIWQINDTPAEMLKAIAHDKDFLFDEDELFHFKAPAVSGLKTQGWGIPETLLNYSELHQLQVYKKMDEYVGLDYLLPFRIFTPDSSFSVSDSIIQQNLGVWANKIDKMIKERRRDPLKMHAFPFPVAYQEANASGKQLVPKDLIEYSENSLHDAMGYPAELFKASLQLQQVPTAVRLFESSFNFLPRGFEKFCQWVSDKVMSYRGQDLMIVSLQKPSMADDAERRSIYLQMAAGGEISRAKAYRLLGIDDPVAEVEERMEEDMEIEETKQRIQSDFERKQQAGSMNQQLEQQMLEQQQMAEQQAAEGGAPAGPPAGPQNVQPNPNSSPLDIMAQAEQEAQNALSIPQDGERRKYLQQIEAQNPTLHAATKQKMEKIRAQGETAGREQTVAQLQQPPG